MLPRWYSSKEAFGVLLPQTSDGRVLFLLPWQGQVGRDAASQHAPVSFQPRADKASWFRFVPQTIAGTTDVATEVSEKPRATKKDVRFLVEELAGFLGSDPAQIE